MFVQSPRASHARTAMTAPVLVLLSLVLLPLAMLSLAAPARADDAAGGRTTAVSMSVANGSFQQGTRHWKAYGSGARLRPTTLGHRDGHALSLTSPRRRPAGLRQVGTSKPVAIDRGRVTASVWVWTPTARRVALRVRTAQGKPVARTSVRVKAHTWQRVMLTRRVTGLRRAGLALDVRAARPTRAGRLLVDDVALKVRTVVDGPTTTTTHTPGTWLSGASGNGVPDGSFADWRGSSVPIAGTWNDNPEAQINQWSIQPGMEYGAWKGDIDDAIGAIYAENGETWAKAATGAYDARWAATLRTMRDDWAGHTGTMYIRFAHEFNGEWYGWKVSGAQTDDFKAAWRRFRALQQDIFPASQLVFCANSTSSASNNLDWRKAFPGAKYVDVMAVDWYNTRYDFIKTGASFHSRLNAVDGFGAPVGLDAYRRFAASQGLPLAISEWSSDGVEGGDSPAFVNSFHSWLAQHGGKGAGDVLYEILFNVGEFQGAKYQLYPSASQPSATDAYRRGW